MNGELHIWDFPVNRYYISIKEDVKNDLIKTLLKICKTKYRAWKTTGVTRATILRIEKERQPKMKLSTVTKILNFLESKGHKKFSLNSVEKSINWIGAPQSNGILNPKLPFNFLTASGARFLAAISGDGSITNGSNSGEKYSLGALFYINNSNQLRNSVIKDALDVFGGNKNVIKTNGIYTFFPFVFRDSIDKITNFKGKKSEINPGMPGIILSDTGLIANWIGQIIADEGNVRNYPDQYEKSITWRRSVDVTDIYVKFKKLNRKSLIKQLGKIKKCNLIEDETRALNKIGINCILRPIEIYFTKDNKVKLRWELRISKKDNLIKLRKLITVPYKDKNKQFTDMLNTKL